MQTMSKMLAFLLLSTLLAAPLVAQGLRPDLGSHERPAGCHEDDGNVPAPEPASHTCCLSAHHPAILQPASALRLALQVSARVDSSQNAAVAAAFDPFPHFKVVSGGPPLVSPLRV